ncbi:MAG: energy-coupling factor ABC transporter ATP-binding protein [Candidatus Omnitrophica bacterium]|nr:energy-coupling factor ABC transporter ATP-binding protein [Candidatus Omnitrophota bacterium]
MIEIKNLSYSYPLSHKKIINGIDLTVDKGDLVLITGPSGSGKSTFLYCLNGLVPHVFSGDMSGSVMIADVDPRLTPISEISRRVGTVFQNPEYQIFMPTVREDVEFGCRNVGLEEESLERNSRHAILELGLDELLDRDTSTLSAGEKQRLAIAGVYAVGPQIILFDEPSTNLDVAGKQSLRKIIKELKDRCYTIVLVEHDTALFEDIATRIYVMENGVLKTGDDAHKSTIRERKAHNFCQDFDAIIEVQDVSYGYDKSSPFFNHLNMIIRKQEVVAFMGNNGSGKTTFFKLLMGILKPQEGRIAVAGDIIRSIDDSAGRIGLLFQNPDEQLFASTVREEIMLGPRQLKKACDCEDIMARFDLKKYEYVHPHALSKGERQKVAFASVAALRPDIILLDEPTTGLDEKSWLALMDYAFSLVKEGTTVLFSTHNRKVADFYADRVVVFDKGRVISDEIPKD